jgi:hypothetical protein
MTHATLATPDTGSAQSPHVRHRVVAAALAASAVIAAVAMLARPIAAEDWHIYAAFSAERDATWLFSMVVGIATGAAFLTLGLAVSLLVRGRGAALAIGAALLLGVGGFGFASGFFASGALNWYATSDAIPESAATDLMTYAEDHPLHVFAPQMAGFLLSSLGCVLVAVALWRSRAVPRWLAVGVPVTLVLMIMAGTGVAYDAMFAVFMASFVAVAWRLWRARTTLAGQR